MKSGTFQDSHSCTSSYLPEKRGVSNLDYSVRVGSRNLRTHLISHNTSSTSHKLISPNMHLTRLFKLFSPHVSQTNRLDIDVLHCFTILCPFDSRQFGMPNRHSPNQHSP